MKAAAAVVCLFVVVVYDVSINRGLLVRSTLDIIDTVVQQIGL